MTFFSLPWLDLAFLVPLFGAAVVSLMRDTSLASRWSLGFTGTAFAAAFLAWLGFYLGQADADATWAVLRGSTGEPILNLDELNAPLVPLAALLHFLTALTTTRTKEGRFSFAWLLVGDATRIGIFGCSDPWTLIGLLVVGMLPTFFELQARGKSTRVFVMHMGLFSVLLVSGWALEQYDGGQSWWASVPLLLAIVVRIGAVPAHCWMVDLFSNASFGTALLFVTPLTAIYAAVRLVLPVAPDWVLKAIGLLSLFTALYAAGMAVVQKEVRRFFAYLCLSHSSMVLVGLELHTSTSLTGALCLWFSLMLALSGFGFTLRAMEARYGRLSLTHYHGLYDQSPMLGVCFLLTGLACVGFPGTLGYVSGELLIDGLVGTNPLIGLGAVLAAAINGIAVVRAYFLLFTGVRHASSVSLRLTRRERFAVLTLAVLILGGGLLPQPGVGTRYRAAEAVLHTRQTRHLDDAEDRAPADGPHSSHP